MIKKEKNIYEIIAQNSNILFDKYKISEFITNKDNKSNIEKILRQKLYELNLNVCNQVIYDYTYIFTNEDLKFIEQYNLYDEIKEIIKITSKDLKKLKSSQ